MVVTGVHTDALAMKATRQLNPGALGQLVPTRQYRDSGGGSACVFIQGEDGIRDIGVAGVQTCALPIFHLTAWERINHVRIYTLDGLLVQDIIPTASTIALADLLPSMYIVVLDVSTGQITRKIVR